MPWELVTPTCPAPLRTYLHKQLDNGLVIRFYSVLWYRKRHYGCCCCEFSQQKPVFSCYHARLSSVLFSSSSFFFFSSAAKPSRRFFSSPPGGAGADGNELTVHSSGDKKTAVLVTYDRSTAALWLELIYADLTITSLDREALYGVWGWEETTGIL